MVKEINNIDPDRSMEVSNQNENEKIDEEYFTSEFALEQHHFHHDYDKYRCPDCDGLGYFYTSPSDLGGLGSFLFPKKECAQCSGKGFLDLD